MRLATGQRAVALGVGEFATFTPGPADTGGGRGGAWRSTLGVVWHQTLREQTAAHTADARFEAPLSAKLLHGGWTIELQGRLDQAVPRDGALVLREIKTVSGPLPRPVEDWARECPEYFRQLAAYRRLAELDPGFAAVRAGRPLAAELVLVDYASGLVQVIPLEAAAGDRWLEAQLAALLPYLEFRWRARQRLAALPARAPFAELRPGQAEARAALAGAAGHPGAVVFTAPTGFGKTGLLLEYALARLRDGQFQRLLYLTGRGTGQTPVTRQLRALLGETPELRFLQVRSRREHAIAAPLHTCDERGRCRADAAARWRAAGLDPLALFADGALPLERVRALGAQTGVCPYEITRACLPYAEVWIGDYNYVLSPAHRGLLFGVPGFDPALTLLVADEAHHIPARAADARSFAFAADDCAAAADALRDARARPALALAMAEFAEWLAPLRPAAGLDATRIYELADGLEGVAAALRGGPLPEEAPEFAVETVFDAVGALDPLKDEALSYLPWVPAPGALRVTCLDAAPALGPALREFGQTVLTSATCGAPDIFLAACGLEAAATRWIEAAAPWRAGAYDVAVDARVDTRLRARAQHYATTAETVRALAAGQPRPVAVFFPSYDYAEAVRAYLEALDSLTRVAVQPRGADLAGQTEFLEQALLTAHAIFFVLGGSFAEGIDRLGGEVERALVVGPALPEPNVVNENRRQLAAQTAGEDEAWRRVYLAPGMLKIAQALGRLVRAPGQRARVLLHCRRFAEPDTRALLPPEYQPAIVLRRDGELAAWLAKREDGGGGD